MLEKVCKYVDQKWLSRCSTRGDSQECRWWSMQGRDPPWLLKHIHISSPTRRNEASKFFKKILMRFHQIFISILKSHGDLRYFICYTKLITLTDEKIRTEKIDKKKRTKKTDGKNGNVLQCDAIHCKDKRRRQINVIVIWRQCTD